MTQTHPAIEAAAHEASHSHPEVLNWIQLIAKATAPSALSDFLFHGKKSFLPAWSFF